MSGPRAQVLAHLRACADVWGNCIMTIIAEDRTTWRAVSPRTWIKQTDYPELEFPPSLRDFTTQRADLLAVLSPLPIDAWARSARVSMVGRVLERTVLSYAERLVVHERSHIKQIACFRDKLKYSFSGIYIDKHIPFRVY